MKLLPLPAVNELKKQLSGLLFDIFTRSIRAAIRAQKLEELREQLEKAVPDISRQYSNFELSDEYYRLKVRGMHAFQIDLVRSAIQDIESPVIVDIGDSSGTHIQYINSLFSDKKHIECLSVNLDKEAVKKIHDKGLDAIAARAEELGLHGINADVFLCFETIEHIMDPCNFLHHLSTKTDARYLVVTIPYVHASRIGLRYVRAGQPETANAENTHIFELSPDDWKTLFRHSGWNVKEERQYLQYPRRGIFAFTKRLWRRYDFEGFYGFVLNRDHSWSSRYTDWQEQ